jgi:serine/threonine protein phosphatase PrpC
MKIETILEKGSARLNEDTLVAQGNIFGVFDGATSLNKTVFQKEKTGGFIASSAARSVFATNHFPLKALAHRANQSIHQHMVRHGVDLTRKENLWSTSAAVVRIQGNTLEWVQTGDAQIILIYQDDTHEVLVDREDHDYDTLCLWPARNKAGSSGTDTRIFEQIRKKRAEMNLTYGVLNGEPHAMDFLNHGRKSLDQVNTVLLFTDGLSIPSEKPAKKKNFTPLITLYRTLGLAGLKHRIRQIEKTDPECRRFPRFKTHDDIAAIAVQDLSPAGHPKEY